MIYRGGSEAKWFLSELRPLLGKQLLGAFYMLASTLLSLVDPLIIKWLIDVGLKEEAWGSILMAVGVFCVAFLARSAFVVLGNMTSEEVLQKLMLRLRLRLLKHVTRLDASFYDRFGAGDLIRRLEQDIDQVGQVGTVMLPTLLRILVSASVTLAIMFFLDWRLTLAAIPFAAIFLLFKRRFRGQLARASEITREAVGQRTSFLHDCLNSSVQVQVLGAEGFFRRKYARYAAGGTRATIDRRRVEMSYFASSFAVLTLATGVVLLLGAYQVLAGALTLGGFIAFYSYLTRLFDPLGAAIDTHARLKRAGASIRRISELESIEPEVESIAGAPKLAAEPVERIACRDVSFGYAEGQPVLDKVGFTLSRGERLAVVGRSGSGKSTLAKLLVRMYDPITGTISVDGDNLRSLDLTSVRAHTSLVFPKPVLFRGSIRENVLLGYTAASEKDLDVCARVACFDSVIAKFPRRWDHVLGPSGAGLSDGEKQRLGLVRALVRNREILILDESTGALDPLIEGRVLTRLREHTRDKAVLMITHRLSAACWADRILVLRNGSFTMAHRPKGFAAYAAEVGETLYSTPDDPLTEPILPAS